MGNYQGVKFGALTLSLHNITFEKIDTNGDGVLTEDELKTATDKNGIDVLDLSCIDKNADSKVTEDEYLLWQQESEISRLTDDMKSQIARTLAGQDANDIKKAVTMLDDYMKSYIQSYTTMNSGISNMAKMYSQELPNKYKEVLNYIRENTKSAIKERVIQNFVEFVEENSKTETGQFSELAFDKYKGFSDNAKRLLSSELEKEAERFVKNYSGDDLEEALTEHLKQFLNTSDKSKLSDEINIWEKGKADLVSLPKELALIETKSKVKSFLQRALKEGVTTIKLGDVTIRNELEMVAALGQYKNYEDLQRDLNRAISQLSRITRLEQIEAINENKASDSTPAQSVTALDNNFDKEEVGNKNIFSAG